MKLEIFFYVFTTIFLYTFSQKVNLSKTYKAAVVEYHTEDIDEIISDDEKILIRTKNHIDLLQSIDEDLEIILFPEKSLYSHENLANISSKIPKKMENICNSSDIQFKEYLKLFSCAASKYNTSIAINVIEKKQCSPEDMINSCFEQVYYNTVVVFDNKGYLAGRYRKWNLFGEYQLTKPNIMDLTVITTKNNIKFGIFNCFDIMFDMPALNLTRDLDIKNILFPNNWISELPYLTALQVQQMWAQENNVVLLSSGQNNPKTGASGTGIYIGNQGPLDFVFIGGAGGSSVIVKTVPNLLENKDIINSTVNQVYDTDTLAEGLDDFFLLRDLSMDDHTAILMPEHERLIEETVCNGDKDRICCHFNISISTLSIIQRKHRYKYHMVAFNGVRSFSGLRNAGIESCGIVACLNESLSSCALRFPNYSEIYWPIVFDFISIEANFSIGGKRIQYPSSLLTSLRPISPKYTTWETEKLPKYLRRKYTLNQAENRLLTFGIFGRDFNRDGDLIIPNAICKSTVASYATILITIICNILFNYIKFYC
ncbi:vanin-like protein 3 isoform X1 [Diorhabda sublineata]|uniref:vanin-like protein 3 isoform X1 n=1 Tax=Diorhabda sublineata TaxID=1163346 RepID=UPI0024E076C3|nr:vanin-like protein 3 isoform X1 [Diorhabda sublineata]